MTEKKIKNLITDNSFSYYFYKIIKLFRNKKKNNHLGEFGEDIIINRFFRKIKEGFYVDVGCYHPYKGSLTYNLYKKGWRGLNIDLSKAGFKVDRISSEQLNNSKIQVNDIITHINNKPVYNSSDFVSKVKQMRNNSLANLLVYRNSNPVYLAIKISK